MRFAPLFCIITCAQCMILDRMAEDSDLADQSSTILIPDVLDRVISHSNVNSMLSWSRVSRSFQRIADTHIFCKFLRKRSETRFEPDLSKITENFETLCMEDRLFWAEWMIGQNERALKDYMRPTLKLLSRSNVDFTATFMNADLFHGFFDLLGYNQISALPYLLQNHPHIDLTTLHSLLTIMATFSSFDDLTLQVIKSRKELVSFETCRILSEIRGKSEILTACSDMIEGDLKWSFYDIPVKPSVNYYPMLAEISKNSTPADHLLKLLTYMIKGKESSATIEPLFKEILKYVLKDATMEIADLYHCLRLVKIVRKYPDIVELGYKMVENNLEKTPIDMEGYAAFFAFFKANKHHAALSNTFGLIFLHFNGNHSAEDLFNQTIKIFGWREIENLIELASLASTQTAEKYIYIMATYSDCDRLTYSWVKRLGSKCDESFGAELAKVRNMDVEKILDEKSWTGSPNYKLVKFYFDETEEQNSAYLISAINYLCEAKVHPKTMLSFIGSRLPRQSSRRSFVVHALYFHIILDDYPDAQEYCLDQLGEFLENVAFHREHEDFSLVSYVSFLAVALNEFGTFPKAFGRLSSVLCNHLSLDFLFEETTMYNHVYIYALLSHRYEEVILQPVMEKFGKPDLLQLFRTCAHMAVPVPKMEILLDKIFDSKASCYKLFKKIGKLKLEAEYVSALTNHPKFPGFINFLLSNKKGFNSLIHILSNFTIANEIHFLVYSNLVRFRHSECKFERFLEVTTLSF